MGTTRNKRKRTATSSRKRNIKDFAFHVRCAVESEENRFSEYVKTSKVPQGKEQCNMATKLRCTMHLSMPSIVIVYLIILSKEIRRYFAEVHL